MICKHSVSKIRLAMIIWWEVRSEKLLGDWHTFTYGNSRLLKTVDEFSCRLIYLNTWPNPFWKCNFPIWTQGWLLRRSVCDNFLKRREVTHPCSYRSTCLIRALANIFLFIILFCFLLWLDEASSGGRFMCIHNNLKKELDASPLPFPPPLPFPRPSSSSSSTTTSFFLLLNSKCLWRFVRPLQLNTKQP